MPPKNSGGSSKFPGGHKVFHRTAQTAFVRVVTPRLPCGKCLAHMNPTIILVVFKAFLSTKNLAFVILGRRCVLI